MEDEARCTYCTCVHEPGVLMVYYSMQIVPSVHTAQAWLIVHQPEYHEQY